MASYPGNTPTFDTKFDYTTVIFAEHVNKLQDELLATQTTLGTNITTGSGWVGTFDQATTSWTTLRARLNNIEFGLNRAHNQRVSTLGGSTVSSSVITVVGLKFAAIASQTANLTEWRTSSDSLVSYVDKDGRIFTSSNQLVPIIYSSSQPSSVPIGTLWVDSTTDVGTLNFQGVVPDGGTDGQVLAKLSNDDYDYGWETVQAGESGFNPFLLGGM